MRRIKHTPAAFTLVELLVVIAIIGTLVALLLPAVMSSIEKSRIAKCANNQKNIGLAIIGYDADKKHLPGYINRVSGANGNFPLIGWVPELFPYLGHTDLWEGANPTLSWRRGKGETPLLPEFVCPDDANKAAIAPLSYVVNVGYYNDPSSRYVISSPGIFRDYSTGTSSALLMTSVKSTTQTILLSELSGEIFLKMPSPMTTVQRQWSNLQLPNTPTPAQIVAAYGFTWPNPNVQGTVAKGTTLGMVFSYLATNAPPVPSYPHANTVIITYCDGRVDQLAPDVFCNVNIINNQGVMSLNSAAPPDNPVIFAVP